MTYQSTLFSGYLGDAEMQRIASDEALIEGIVQFEAALAKGQAQLGIISQKVADELTAALSQVKIEPKDLVEGTLQHGIPIIPLLSIIKENLSSEGQKYLHFGATSQDALDTAQVLLLKKSVEVLGQRIATLIGHLSVLKEQVGPTPCMAHTRGQQALPITFDVKIGAWLQPLTRQLHRLEELQPRLFKIQLGGAVGTLSGFGKQGEKLRELVAGELGLQSAPAWHNQRDTFGEYANWLVLLTGTIGKMGGDVLVMAQSELGEVVENGAEGGKSSAMPHKNNPVLSEALVALATLNAGLQSLFSQSMLHKNERDGAALIIEWVILPQLLLNAGTSLKHALTIASTMEVNTEAMRKNVDEFLQKNAKK